MSAHYYDHWQELRQYALGGLGEGAETLDDSSSWHPSVRFALDEAWEALQVYANVGTVELYPFDQDAMDAYDAAMEFLRGASLGMGA